MLIRRKLKRYITNLISFANSRIHNNLRDHSSEYFAGDVTLELKKLMNRVWEPIVGQDCEIIVLHIKKPLNAKGLGIRLNGMTRTVQIQPSQSMSPNAASEAEESLEERHFVHTIFPDGLIGQMGVMFPGDELLQANGQRLRGVSVSDAVKCLRSLPTHIELVLARNKYGHMQSVNDFNADSGNFYNEHLHDDASGSILQVRGSEISSVQSATSDYKPVSNGRAGSAPLLSPPPLVSLRTSQTRVEDWVRHSQPDIQFQGSTSPSGHIVTTEQVEPWTAPYPPGSPTMPDSLHHLSLSDISSAHPENNRIPRPASVSRSQTLPSRSRQDYNSLPYPSAVTSLQQRIDPKFGSMRPVWSDTPLLIQLRKTTRGFGFSLSEYEELVISDASPQTERHSKFSTFARRRSSRRRKSTDDSVGVIRRCTSLPRTKRDRKRRIILLIDSIDEQGALQKDGRVSTGDRLLFVNDRNLSESDLNEARLVLTAIPPGPCLLGIAKMYFEPNFPKIGEMSIDITDGNISDLFDVDHALDHPLNFNVTIEPDRNADLHLHTLSVPPVDAINEKQVHVVLNKLPIGLKLDALAVGGQDGCRVVQILPGGALDVAHVLGRNDYITSLNGHPMRSLTNAEAFMLIHSISTQCDYVDITFIPGNVIEKHRLEHINMHHHLQYQQNKLSICGPTIPSEVVLYRDSDETDWGIVLASASASVYSSVVTDLVAGSPADRSEQMEIGDCIVQVAGINTEQFSATQTVKLLANCITNGDKSLCINVVRLSQLQVKADVEHCMNDAGSVVAVSRDISPEAPEPLTELESRDELNVLSRFLPLGPNTTDSSGDELSMNKSGQLTTAVLTSITPEEVELKYTNVSSTPPPTIPPRHNFSFDQRRPSLDEQQLIELPESTDLVSYYTRSIPSDDKVVCLSLLKSAHTGAEIGVRLVGPRATDQMTTYVSGFTNGSSVAAVCGMQVGDEIVQIGQTEVAGQSPVIVLRCLNKKLSPDEPLKTSDASLLIVVRRNPQNFACMSYPQQSVDLEETIETKSFKKMNHEPRKDTDEELVLLPSRPCDDLVKQIRESFGSKLVDQLEMLNVNLIKEEKGFGLYIVNLDAEGKTGIFVNELTPDGAAALQGELHANDRILAVNGEIASSYDFTLRMLQQSGNRVALTIGRMVLSSTKAEPVSRKPSLSFLPNESVRSEAASASHNSIQSDAEIRIHLVKEAGSLGFSIVGGKTTPVNGIRIHEVHAGGVAARDGQLLAGDLLLSVNGTNLLNAEHEDAINIIRSTGDQVELVISREPRLQNLSTSVVEEIEIHLNKLSKNENIGLALASRLPYSRGTVIRSIMEESAAGRCGLFQVGDIILSVNDKDMRMASLQTVATALKKSGKQVKFTIGRSKTADSQLHPPSTAYRLRTYTVALQRSTTDPTINMEHRISIQTELLGFSNVGQIGYGIYLNEASTGELQHSNGQLVVGGLHHGGAAELTGMIMPGDRLLCVNREPIDWLSPADVFIVFSKLESCTLELGRPEVPYECPPYPVDSQSLPEIFSGSNLCEFQPAASKIIETLDEEGKEIGFRTSTAKPLDSQLHERSFQDWEEQSSADMSEVSKSATDSNPRFSVGFQLRVVDLPLDQRVLDSGYESIMPQQSPKKRLSLGLRLVDGPGISGPIIVKIKPDSPASNTSLAVGDRILGLDDRLLVSMGPDMTAKHILQVIEQAWIARSHQFAVGHSLDDGALSVNPVRLTVVSTGSAAATEMVAAQQTIQSTELVDNNPVEEIQQNSLDDEENSIDVPPLALGVDVSSPQVDQIDVPKTLDTRHCLLSLPIS